MNTLTFLCLAALLYQGLCCSKKKNPPAKGNVWQRMVGQDITTAPYSGNGDSPVDTGDQLNCDFESGGCCWSNANPPTDQLDWVTVSGPSEPAKVKSSFGTDTAPTPTALGVGSETSASDGSAQQAQLYSCPIACSEGSITVSLKHWQSKDVTIQVCEEQDPAGPPSNCKSLPTTSGNADSVSLPGGQNVRLVIVANGFTTKTGSVAIIDDINVQFSQCVTTTTSTTTEATTTTTVTQASTVAPAVCKSLTCNFEQANLCSYTNSGGSKQWAAVTAPFQNRLTGINAAAEGKYMNAVYLNPGDTAVMSTNVNFPAGYIVQFQGYRATEGVDLMACCDTVSNCPYSTTSSVQVSDYRSWKQATVTCPQGTSKVLFQAKNSGTNFGAAGLDNIQVVSQVGSSPLC
jgi:hypothetical protein